jgi:hypothetical protein
MIHPVEVFVQYNSCGLEADLIHSSYAVVGRLIGGATHFGVAVGFQHAALRDGLKELIAFHAVVAPVVCASYVMVLFGSSAQHT